MTSAVESHQYLLESPQPNAKRPKICGEWPIREYNALFEYDNLEGSPRKVVKRSGTSNASADEEIRQLFAQPKDCSSSARAARTLAIRLRRQRIKNPLEAIALKEPQKFMDAPVPRPNITMLGLSNIKHRHNTPSTKKY